jgi:putative transposase
VRRHSRSTTGRSPSKDTEQLPEPLAGEGAHILQTEDHASVGVLSVVLQVTIVPSMGRTRTVLNNAMAECFIVTLKTELVHWRRFPPGGSEKCYLRVSGGLCNRCRLHSAMSFRRPANYEETTTERVAVA